MRRHDALIPLSHDHHHALKQARLLKRDATAEPEVRALRAREFVEFFHADSVEHFRREEEQIFPLVADRHEIRPLLMHLLVEHVEIHALVQGLEEEMDRFAVQGKTLARMGTKLEEHVRLEEKKVFPLIERLASDSLGSLARTSEIA